MPVIRKRSPAQKKEKVIRDSLTAAMDVVISGSILILRSPAFDEDFMSKLQALSPRKNAKMIRSGRLSLLQLHENFTDGVSIPLGAHETISTLIHSQHTLHQLLKHSDCPDRLPVGGDKQTMFFYAWVAAMAQVLTPDELALWYAGVFGPIIASMEEILKSEEARDQLQDDDDEEDTRPHKKQRLTHEDRRDIVLKCFREVVPAKPASPTPPQASVSSSLNPPSPTTASTSWVKSAVARIEERTPSIVTQAQEPPEPKMPGAWCPSPPRRSSTAQERSLIRRTVSNPAPRHFCDLLN
ncbi:hypothetical protein R3P38DRAFT_3203536 [Favolaschia claudopus]|uniref:Uncharacterized protein n=1 Tax=Favolaschia claudopus TaxID=2862362 RepID=A0AAW0ASB1_9AGAR